MQMAGSDGQLAEGGGWIDCPAAAVRLVPECPGLDFILCAVVWGACLIARRRDVSRLRETSSTVGRVVQQAGGGLTAGLVCRGRFVRATSLCCSSLSVRLAA